MSLTAFTPDAAAIIGKVGPNEPPPKRKPIPKYYYEYSPHLNGGPFQFGNMVRKRNIYPPSQVLKEKAEAEAENAESPPSEKEEAAKEKEKKKSGWFSIPGLSGIPGLR